MLAPLNRCFENLRIVAVVISELKFRDVQRQIFGADFVKAANDTAFEDAPEALNRIGVYSADDVLADAVLDRLMRVVGEARIYCLLSGKPIVQLNH
jgi:hypothetical protein